MSNSNPLLKGIWIFENIKLVFIDAEDSTSVERSWLFFKLGLSSAKVTSAFSNLLGDSFF